MRRMNDEAITPVVGVILMVALAVVLAAVLGVALMSTAQTENTLTLFQVTDEGDGEMQVVRTPDNLRYSNLKFPGGCTVLTVEGAPIEPTNAVLPGDHWTTDCVGGDTFTIMHYPSNKLVRSTTYGS